MAYGPNDQFSSASSERSSATFDQGLRSYMLSIYNFMASGLALTGIVAYGASQSEPLMQAIFGNQLLMWVVMLSPFAFVLVLSFGINKLKSSTAQALFWAFSITMGLSLSSIFLVYTGASITRVFFITSGTFAAMSLYGYTTKRDLTGFGSFLMMGLIGIIIASIVNMFLASSALHFAISVIGVLVFVGLTAYDTQKLKAIYSAADGAETSSKKVIMGALTLYLDFINLFLMLLRLFGDRR